MGFKEIVYAGVIAGVLVLIIWAMLSGLWNKAIARLKKINKNFSKFSD